MPLPATTTLQLWCTPSCWWVSHDLFILHLQVDNTFTRDYYTAIVAYPFVLVGVFGVASLTIIAYRVYTFRDCPEAAKELQQQIVEARKDLAKKGMKFDDTANS